MMRSVAAGVHALLPLGTRVHAKLCDEINAAMRSVSGQRCVMPSLIPAELWHTSGRWTAMGSELFRLRDRGGHDFCLGPTHEEPFTVIVAQTLTSWRQLPWRLYQIGPKYRDEARPRYGLIRGREFWMKDMYTFDVDEATAAQTYEEVTATYRALFRRLALPTAQVKADTGDIGGTMSHEFQVPSAVGDDEIVRCGACGKAANRELWDRLKDACDTPGCADAPSTTSMGLEVGHAFLLGTKYSDAFSVTFTDDREATRTAVMGCFGIGVSRLLAAVAEAHHDEHGAVWPPCVAPYRVAVVVLNGGLGKRGAETAEAAVRHGEALYDALEARGLVDDVILDTSDRSAGVKLAEAALVGYPWCVVVGRRHDPDALEVKRRVAGAGSGGHGASVPMTLDALVAEIERETAAVGP